VQEPLAVGERRALHRLSDELRAEAAAAKIGQDVDVREVGDRDAVAEGTREADLAVARVEADDPRGLANRALDRLARPSSRQ
jgi:hypothetical protein